MESPISAADPMAIEPGRGALVRTPSFISGSAIWLFWLACAAAPGVFTTWGENDFVVNAERLPITRASPRADAWFGTDSVGRDVFARVVYGADDMVVTVLAAALAAVVAGAVIGLIMGIGHGWIDEVLRRTVEAVAALPVVVFVVMLSVSYGYSRLVVILVFAGLVAPVVALRVRSAVLAEAQRDYVAAANGQGEPARHILVRKILPNISNTLVLEFVERLRLAIFAAATLAFLGFGVGEADANWGRDFAETYPLLQAGQWWSSIFPALAIVSLACATNLIASTIDKVDQHNRPPRSRKVIG